MTFPVTRIGHERPGTRLALAVAAIAMVAVVGINLVPDLAVADGRDPSTTSAAAPATVTRPSRTVEPVLRHFPPPGALDTGWHSLTVEGYPFAVRIPAAGWTSRGANVGRSGGRLAKGTRGAPDGAVIDLWSPDHVYTDPCAQRPSPTIGPLAGDLAAAIADLPGVHVAGPFDVTVRFGPPVKHLVLTIPGDVACEPRQLRLWYDGLAGPRLPASPGSTIRVWIANWGGPGYGAGRIFIEAETFAGASREVELEIASIVGSMIPNRQAPEPPHLNVDEEARLATVEQVDAICRAATERLVDLEPGIDDAVAWSDAAVRIADEALAELRSVPPPERDRDTLEWLLDFLEPPIDALRGVRAAAGASDAAGVESLLGEYGRAADEKDWRVSFYSGGWYAMAVSLRSCPVAFEEGTDQGDS